MADFDAVICGAGIGGLALAHVLDREGWRVLLVERQREVRPVHKGELLQPRSLEILERLGLLSPLHQAGALVVDRLRCVSADGEELAALDYRLLPSPYDHGLLHDHRTLRQAIADRIPPRVEFWQGTRVTGLRTDAYGRFVGISAMAGRRERPVSAALVAACDGHGSRLRTAARIRVRKRRYRHDLVSFELGGVDDLGRDMTAYLTDHGLRVLFQLPGNRARLYVQVPQGSFRSIDNAGRADWARWLLTTVPALHPIRDSLLASLEDMHVLGSWRFTASPWTRPGLVLVGDAAHSLHPMVGQGMNAAIADAWELGRQLRGVSPDDGHGQDRALREYEKCRARHLDYLARLSHNLALLFTGTSWPIRVARPRMLRRNHDNVRLQSLLTANMAGLTVRPFTVRDWLYATGIVPDPLRGTPTETLLTL